MLHVLLILADVRAYAFHMFYTNLIRYALHNHLLQMLHVLYKLGVHLSTLKVIFTDVLFSFTFTMQVML